MLKSIRLLSGFVVAVAMAAACASPSSPSSASGATIAGSVSGAPTAGLSVGVAGTNLSSAVDTEGRFEIANVPGGNRQLQFAATGVSAAADVSNVSTSQFIELQVQLSGSSATIVSDVRSAKVTLCHNEGNDSYHAITVSESAEAAHRAHGDGKVGEIVPGHPTMRFDANCRAVGPGIQIMKLTNGWDANEPPGPKVLVGDPVNWTYIVSNIGTAPLTGVVVTDDHATVTVTCPGTTLALGATMTCTASGVAVLGQYRNVGTATGNWTVNSTPGVATDTDPSHYLGVETLEDDGPKVSLCHKTGNGTYHLINVSVSAEPAHRSHGDGKVGEGVPGQPGKVFGPTCSVQ